jgi:hypothetical protein
MVVLGIAVFITGIALSYGGIARRQTALYVEETRIGEYILKAKSLTLSVRGHGEIGNPCGYGVHIDYPKSAFFIFSYSVTSTGAGVFDAGAACKNVTNAFAGQQGESPSAQSWWDVVENSSTTLSQDTSEVVFDDSPGNLRKLDTVLFIAPEPKVVIWEVRPNNSSAVVSYPAFVYLKTSDGNVTSTVSVNTFGQVAF